MTPRELLLSRLAQAYVPAMAERGFRFSPSGPHFSRRVGEVRQRVSVSSSQWNAGGECTFWTLWSAHNPVYKKWHLAHWGVPADHDWLGGCADWNIPGWSRGPSVLFRLHGDVRDHIELTALLDNSVHVGIPYLDLVSTWTGAAQELLRWRWHFDLACDFLLIAGDAAAARNALLTGIDAFENRGMSGLAREIPGLRKRLDRLSTGGAA